MGCCCQAFAIQICYCLLAQLRGAGAVYGGCAQAGVQLGEAAYIQACRGLQCICRVMEWRLSHCRCKKPVFCVLHPHFLLVLPVSCGSQLPLLVAVAVLVGWDEICQGQMPDFTSPLGCAVSVDDSCA